MGGGKRREERNGRWFEGEALASSLLAAPRVFFEGTPGERGRGRGERTGEGREKVRRGREKGKEKNGKGKINGF